MTTADYPARLWSEAVDRMATVLRTHASHEAEDALLTVLDGTDPAWPVRWILGIDDAAPHWIPDIDDTAPLVAPHEEAP